MLQNYLLIVLITFHGAAAYVRMCYFTDWAHYRDSPATYTPEDYEVGLCTHILYAFAQLNDNFTAGVFDSEDLPTDGGDGNYYGRVNALKQNQTDLKTLLSFGGWNADITLYSIMASSAANRAIFINSSITLAKENGFDGIDIDWEYPVDSTEANNFVSLYREFREAAGSDFVLVAAVSADPQKIAAGYNVTGLEPYIDYVNVLTYDFHGSWESYTGIHSPLYAQASNDTTHWNSAYALNYWYNAGMPKSKLTMGIATYGRGWQLSNILVNGTYAPGVAGGTFEYTQTAGIAAYIEICPLLTNATRYWNNYAKNPYIVTPTGLWIGYDDVESITDKMNYVIENGFGGAFVWTLDFDDFNGKFCGGSNYPLINTLKNILEGNSTSPTTSSSSTTSTTASLTTVTTTTIPTTEISSTTTSTSTASTTTDAAAAFVCTSEGYFRDPTSCSRFYVCAHGIAYLQNCPSGLYFDTTINVCNWPNAVTCDI